MSKTHASTEQEKRADLDRFRREPGTDQFNPVRGARSRATKKTTTVRSKPSSTEN